MGKVDERKGIEEGEEIVKSRRREVGKRRRVGGKGKGRKTEEKRKEGNKMRKKEEKGESTRGKELRETGKGGGR